MAPEPVFERIACIGAGTIGWSWAVVFARAGHSVRLFDPSADALRDAEARCAAELGRMRQRVSTVGTLAEALEGTVYVQESIPERLPAKRKLFEAMAQHDDGRRLYGSSTSTLPGSQFLCALPISDRCIIAHPTNPPHQLPLVELARTGATSDGAFAAIWQLLMGCGQVPVEIRQEVFGFALNRLQAALVAEALSLVGDGVIGARDLDRVMTDGLGLRWAVLGPFAAGHLNADGGYLDYMTKFREPWEALFEAVGRPLRISDGLIGSIHDELGAAGNGDVRSRQRRRDRLLAAVRECIADARATDRGLT